LDGSESTGTRERILAAARREFIDKGLGGARMQAIADLAGINKALLHYHFRDKESLYSAAVESVVTQVMQRVAATFSQQLLEQDPVRALRSMVRNYVLLLRDNPELVGMAMRELSDGGQHLSELMSGIAPLVGSVSSGLRAITTTLGSGVARGKRPPALGHVAPVEQLLPQMMLNLMSMIWGTFLLQPIYTRMLPAAGFALQLDDAFFEQRIETIAGMVIASLGLEER